MMPTKRRVMIFLVVLTLMLLAKYVLGQEAGESVGWDPQHCWDCGDEAFGYGLVAVIFGPLFGVVAGLGKAWKRHVAGKAGRLYQGEMVRLGLSR